MLTKMSMFAVDRFARNVRRKVGGVHIVVVCFGPRSLWRLKDVLKINGNRFLKGIYKTLNCLINKMF